MDSPLLAATPIVENIANQLLVPPENVSADYDLQQSYMRAVLLSMSVLFRNFANASAPLPLDPELGSLIPMFTLPALHTQATNEQSHTSRQHTPGQSASRESLVND